MTIEDQLTVQRNWNLHPSNPNPDMTGLKDAYKSGGDNYLGNKGQIRMEVNDVSNQVQNVPVSHSTQNPTPNVPVTLDCRCKDTLNLGNCYGCNKPGHLKRNCLEGNSTQTQARYSDNRGSRKDPICFNCDKPGHFARQCRGPKKNYKRDNLHEEERIMKIVQKMLVKSNRKAEDFQ